MAKPATRMKSIVLKSFSGSRTQRLARSVLPAPPQRRKECAALTVCCDQLTHGRADPGCSPALRADLRAAIEDMVIPRLLVGQCLPPAAASYRRGRVLPTQTEVDLLARIAVLPDLEQAMQLSLGMLGAGLSLETVLLSLIGPAARRLGTDWEEDLRSWADVTVGLGTLHELVHLLARRDAGDGISSVPSGTEYPCKSALLVRGPGEQHTLGLYIFAELLRHSSWVVALEADMSGNTLLQTVRSQAIDMLGIAVSTPERFSALTDLIRSVRRTSLNRGLRVIIGGPIDLSREAEREGVTYHADARHALDWLERE